MADFLDLHCISNSVAVVIGILALLVVVADCQSCTPESGCRVKLSSGETLDFCASFDSGAARWAANNDIYTFNSRDGVDCDVTYPGQAVCQSFSESPILFGCGLVSNAACSVVSMGNNLTISMEYRGGENDRLSIVMVLFEQGRSQVDFSFQSLDPQSNIYSFTYRVPHNGGPSEAIVDPGIPGIIIIIVLLCIVVAYFVIGVLVMRFYKGARGVEMIPNLSFWKDFPFLLKDGFVFTFTAWPCCPYSQYKRVG